MECIFWILWGALLAFATFKCRCDSCTGELPRSACSHFTPNEILVYPIQISALGHTFRVSTAWCLKPFSVIFLTSFLFYHSHFYSFQQKSKRQNPAWVGFAFGDVYTAMYTMVGDYNTSPRVYLLHERPCPPLVVFMYAE